MQDKELSAFRKGILYASMKYDKDRGTRERVVFGDVADFLYMEALEIDDAEIGDAVKDVIEYYELEDL